ncbi:hypothetical protein AB837_00461 [bacterium AB1]|nr:hypothetical protein AB837_00461 [bacterium AB1]
MPLFENEETSTNLGEVVDSQANSSDPSVNIKTNENSDDVVTTSTVTSVSSLNSEETQSEVSPSAIGEFITSAELDFKEIGYIQNNHIRLTISLKADLMPKDNREVENWFKLSFKLSDEQFQSTLGTYFTSSKLYFQSDFCNELLKNICYYHNMDTFIIYISSMIFGAPKKIQTQKIHEALYETSLLNSLDVLDTYLYYKINEMFENLRHSLKNQYYDFYSQQTVSIPTEIMNTINSFRTNLVQMVEQYSEKKLSDLSNIDYMILLNGMLPLMIGCN